MQSPVNTGAIKTGRTAGARVEIEPTPVALPAVHTLSTCLDWMRTLAVPYTGTGECNGNQISQTENLKFDAAT